jgi:small-conductance mechanosensitive channel
MDLLESLQESATLRNVVASVVLLVALLLGRAVALRWLLRQNMPGDSLLRWRAQVRNAVVLVLLLGLTVVWAEVLRAVAISVVAIAAALVIGMKELLMCLTGSLLRASGQQFRIGDRIEIAGHRGDVIDIGPLTTSLLEVGPGAAIHQRSGRVVVLPNSVFLGGAVVNETITHEYVVHVLRVPMALGGEWKGARDRLLALANEIAAPYIGDASDTMTRMAVARGLTQPAVRPSVVLELTKPGELDLLLRFPAPAHERGRIEQQILERFLE